MNKECELVETIEETTSGEKIIKLFCYCGTTGCEKFPNLREAKNIFFPNLNNT